MFRTGTDTEVLLAAYQQWGLEMLPRLAGMFAFALWDARANKLVCARDPFCIKPFYYTTEGEWFIFASEPRAVLAGLGSPGHVDAAHVAEFLVLGISDHDEGTNYQEVRQLRGGHWLEVDTDGSISPPRTFWRPPRDGIDEGEDVPAQVRERIELTIRRQLRADVPVGICLSGGLDSGTIVSAATSVLGSRAADLKALTLASKDFEGDETEMAGITAKWAGVRWVKVEPDRGQIGEDLEKVIRIMDAPFDTLAVLGQYKVMQSARDQGLKVVLDGQGGDEVFLGYPQVAQRVIGEYLKRGHVPAAVREWLAFRRNASQPLATSLLGLLCLSTPEPTRWCNSWRLRGLVAAPWLEQVRSEVAHDMFNGQSITRVQIGDLTRYSLPRMLQYEDRISMAFGLEARVPLLGVALVDLGLRLPLCWKVRNGWTKYALRLAMKDRLPEEILWQRRKRGFPVPQRRWVEAARRQIAGWLADLPGDGPVNRAAILARIDAGQGGAPWLWRCVSVALWLRFSGVRL